MEIKKLTRADLSTICNWHKEHVRINFPDSKYKKTPFENKVKEYLVKDDQFKLMIKVVQDNKMAAWLWLIKVWDEFKDIYYCDLHYIHVHKSLRGQGVGKRLMRMTEDWAKENGMKEIRLGTNWDNRTARKIYDHAGFIKKRILMEKRI